MKMFITVAEGTEFLPASEVTGISISEDFQTPDLEDRLVITVSTKSGLVVPITGEPAKRLRAWIATQST